MSIHSTAARKLNTVVHYSLDYVCTLIMSSSRKVVTFLGGSIDRDSAAWKLSDKAVQRRRNLFWELFSLEMIHVRNIP